MRRRPLYLVGHFNVGDGGELQDVAEAKGGLPLREELADRYDLRIFTLRDISL